MHAVAAELPLEQDQPQARRLHLNALTGMRIVAALAVYFSHLGPPHGSPHRLVTIFASGYTGVTFFFVLSGFVLAINYFERLRVPSIRGIWSFVVARLARVYPLYVLILVYFILRTHAQGLPINGWVEHLLAVQAWSPSVTRAYAFNGPGWSIGVEFFLYAMFPILVFVIARLERGLWSLLAIAVAAVAALVVLVVLFSVSGRNALPWANPDSAHRWLYRTPVTRLGDFVLGIVMARMYLRLRFHSKALPLGSALIYVAIVSSILLAASQRNLYSAESWDLSWAVPASALVLGLAIAPRNLIARLLAVPLIVFLGEASYAFYLCHWLVLRFTGAGAWVTATTPWTISFEAFNLAIALCFAAGLHLFVERPARVFVRRTLDRPPRMVASPPPSAAPGAPAGGVTAVDARAEPEPRES